MIEEVAEPFPSKICWRVANFASSPRTVAKPPFEVEVPALVIVRRPEVVSAPAFHTPVVIVPSVVMEFCPT